MGKSPNALLTAVLPVKTEGKFKIELETLSVILKLRSDGCYAFLVTVSRVSPLLLHSTRIFRCFMHFINIIVFGVVHFEQLILGFFLLWGN